jgi:hypothetical protein
LGLISSTLGALQRLGLSAWLVPEFSHMAQQNCRELLGVGRAIARFALGLDRGQIAATALAWLQFLISGRQCRHRRLYGQRIPEDCGV